MSAGVSRHGCRAEGGGCGTASAGASRHGCQAEGGGCGKATAASAQELDVAPLAAFLSVDVDPGLLIQAMRHRSYAYEHGRLPTNERFEFLGDSVLGFVVTTALFDRHPDVPEGQLAKLRAAVVNGRRLADVARGLQLGRYLLLGRGEEVTGGREKDSLLADALEAVIGVVYLDRGMGAAGALVHRLFDSAIEESGTLGAGLDWKTSLQEAAAAEDLGAPEYAVEESGPDHAKRFRAKATVSGTSLGEGVGTSKKAAEQAAAAAAWRALRQPPTG